MNREQLEEIRAEWEKQNAAHLAAKRNWPCCSACELADARVPALLDEIDRQMSTLHAVLMGAAEDYRQCIVAARASMSDADYQRCNGRAEAYRQAATRLAESSGLPIPDWDRIRREVPADGVYRPAKQVRYWWHHNDCGPTPGGDGTTKLFCIGCGNSTGEWRRGDPIAPDSATTAEGSAEGGTSKGSEVSP